MNKGQAIAKVSTISTVLAIIPLVLGLSIRGYGTYIYVDKPVFYFFILPLVFVSIITTGITLIKAKNNQTNYIYAGINIFIGIVYLIVSNTIVDVYFRTYFYLD